MAASTWLICWRALGGGTRKSSGSIKPRKPANGAAAHPKKKRRPAAAAAAANDNMGDRCLSMTQPWASLLVAGADSRGDGVSLLLHPLSDCIGLSHM